MTKILVTGGAGYIGSIVSEGLLDQGHSVVVLDNLQEGHRKAVLPRAVFVEGNLADKNLLEEIFRSHDIKAVIHMAAETTIEFSMADPRRYFQNNVVSGLNLLDAMLKFGVHKMIFSSTAAVYGEPEYIPITEGHPQRPINAYGESKLMFEKILNWYHRAYGIKYASFRYFNAAGASERLGEDHKHESHLIPLVIETALGQQKSGKEENKRLGNSELKEKAEDKVVKILGTDYPTRDGTCVRDYIHVADLARAHILALDALDELKARIYNLGNGEGYTVREVIETARKITGVDIPAVEVGRRAGDPAILVASAKRAKEELGWEPQYPDLELIVRSAWKWRRKHPHGYD